MFRKKTGIALAALLFFCAGITGFATNGFGLFENQERETELDINCCCLLDKLANLRNAVSRSARDHPLSKQFMTFESYENVIEFAIHEARKRDVYMLGSTMEWHGVHYQDIINRR